MVMVNSNDCKQPSDTRDSFLLSHQAAVTPSTRLSCMKGSHAALRKLRTKMGSASREVLTTPILVVGSNPLIQGTASGATPACSVT